VSWDLRRTGQKKGLRRGDVFGVRLTAEERTKLEALRAGTAGPDALGPWLVWAAQQAAELQVLPRLVDVGTTPPPRDRVGSTGAGVVGSTPPRPTTAAVGPVIFDLCAGSGAWSEPYTLAGYNVVRMTLPEWDVREIDTFRLHASHPEVRGILAAPPCTEFSLAKNGQDRDFAVGLETVCACLRIIACFRPKWWALENPVGLLGRWLGAPRDVFEPYEFGDDWTKRTALWGSFVNPTRGPFVKPTRSAMDRSTAAERAITPPGFARAFFEANP